jgi:hypothetical protein
VEAAFPFRKIRDGMRRVMAAFPRMQSTILIFAGPAGHPCRAVERKGLKTRKRPGRAVDEPMPGIFIIEKFSESQH